MGRCTGTESPEGKVKKSKCGTGIGEPAGKGTVKKKPGIIAVLDRQGLDPPDECLRLAPSDQLFPASADLLDRLIVLTLREHQVDASGAISGPFKIGGRKRVELLDLRWPGLGDKLLPQELTEKGVIAYDRSVIIKRGDKEISVLEVMDHVLDRDLAPRSSFGQPCQDGDERGREMVRNRAAQKEALHRLGQV
jgi:hypothetical protein